MRTWTHHPLLIALLLTSGWGCKGEVQRIDDAMQTRPDAGPADLASAREAAAPADGAVRYDATTRPGDPCTFAQCAENMICMANVCRKKCTQTVCHSKPTECEADERCVYGSDFTGACLPATNIYRELCDQQDWLACTEGTLCIRVDSAPARCILVCETSADCPAGIECTALNPPNEMCKVCPE